MKLTILYFSGTGNTDYVAHYLARKLEVVPLDVELRSIEQQAPEAVAGHDFLALGFPVYKCDAPGLVQRYAARLPPGRGRGVYVFCTKGAVAGNAVRRSLRRLASRGYVPLGGGSVGMPGSDGLAFVGKASWMAQAALRKDYDRLMAVDRLAAQMTRELSATIGGGAIDAFRQPLPLSITGALFDGLWIAVYDAFASYLRRSFWADERCAGCDLCARICPVGSIEMVRGRPHFGAGCELCMRCIHACPYEAIQIGRGTVGKFRWHGPTGDFRALRLRPADLPTKEAA